MKSRGEKGGVGGSKLMLLPDMYSENYVVSVIFRYQLIGRLINQCIIAVAEVHPFFQVSEWPRSAMSRLSSAHRECGIV